MKHTVRDAISNYIYLFLLFSMIGWIYEVVLAFLYGYGFVNRGFLFGPYLPLYGFGALLLIVCLKRLMEHSFRIGGFSITPLFVFLLITLITTAVEYSASLFLETAFNQRFWDYSTYTYQLHGRICLSASLRFGIGGMVFLYLLMPLFTKAVNKIPPKPRFLLAVIIIAVLAADLVCTLYAGAVDGFNPVLAQPKF